MTGAARSGARSDDDVGTEIDLVVVGHFGFAEDRTPHGRRRNLGGSGYACAVGVGAGRPERVGVVARIGDDFDTTALRRLGVDLHGAATTSGPAPHLTITQYSAVRRSFVAHLGVASEPATDAFPRRYLTADHVHLATMPPQHQFEWLAVIRRLMSCRISVDMFEQSVVD